jgi:hypothetical protein
MKPTRIGGGIERWMFLLPLAALAMLVIVYAGGPDQALDSLERLAYQGWDRLVMLFRR